MRFMSQPSTKKVVGAFRMGIHILFRKKKARSPLPEPNVRNKAIVIYNRQDSLFGLTTKQGLFAEFFAVLGALNYGEKHQAAGVKVFFNSDLYRDNRRGPNWWSYFFEPTMMFKEHSSAAPEKHIKYGRYRFGPYAWNESWDTQIIPTSTDLYPYPLHSELELKRVNELTKKYIKIQPHILEKARRFLSTHVSDDQFVIGLHYRGTDKIISYPYYALPYPLFLDHVKKILAHYAPSRYKVFVATDQAEFLTWAQETFKDKLFYLEYAPRLSAADRPGRKKGAHKSTRFANYIKGESAVLDCLILAGCDYLIKNRSALSSVSMAFNPAMEWTFVLDQNTICSSNPEIFVRASRSGYKRASV